MTDTDGICRLVMNWADQCDKLRKLQPSRREFSKAVIRRIYQVTKDRIPPMRLETLKENCPELYTKLMT
jgi:hypothetical protein